MNIHLSDWLTWDRRTEVDDKPGVYVIKKRSEDDIVYIGLTRGRGGLRKRLRDFNRSATMGVDGHAGGVTFHKQFGAGMDDVEVSTHVPVAINPDPTILDPYLMHAERLLIWQFVERVGRLPVCNSE